MNEFVCHTIDPPKIKFNPDPSNLRKKNPNFVRNAFL